jgi:hypothetical protein
MMLPRGWRPLRIVSASPGKPWTRMQLVEYVDTATGELHLILVHQSTGDRAPALNGRAQRQE